MRRRALGFEQFLADVGPRPSPEMMIERIDKDQGYKPGNVKWATRSEQMLNRRPWGSVKKAA